MGQVFSRVYAQTPPNSSMEEIGTGWMGPIALGTIADLGSAEIQVTCPGFNVFQIYIDNSNASDMWYRVSTRDPAQEVIVVDGALFGPFAPPVATQFGNGGSGTFNLYTFMAFSLFILNLGGLGDATDVVVRLAGSHR